MNKRSGFTIVELLVVIVVIGVLAAITIVSYSGINNRAISASLQSDLTNASKLFNLFSVENGSFPATISTNCATNPDTTTNKCLKPSDGNQFSDYDVAPGYFYIMAKRGGVCYDITNTNPPTVNANCTSAWITIGAQRWARENLNVGTMLASASTNPANNGAVEKWCYNNLESNCSSYGGLYNWDEAMQYTTTEGAQGICPTGSHIPTDNEYTTLTTFLGGASTASHSLREAGTSRWNSPNTGATNSSGFTAVGSGRVSSGSFQIIGQAGYVWSSTENGVNAWPRTLSTSYAVVDRVALPKANGYSVRCLKN